jgi:hypothetical protein
MEVLLTDRKTGGSSTVRNVRIDWRGRAGLILQPCIELVDGTNEVGAYPAGFFLLKELIAETCKVLLGFFRRGIEALIQNKTRPTLRVVMVACVCWTDTPDDVPSTARCPFKSATQKVQSPFIVALKLILIWIKHTYIRGVRQLYRCSINRRYDQCGNAYRKQRPTNQMKILVETEEDTPDKALSISFAIDVTMVRLKFPTEVT